MTRIKKPMEGFSKLSKRGKLRWIVENFFKDPERVMKELTSYWLLDEEKQRLLDQFSENTISNFHLPYGVAPNFLINGTTYCVPMVTEESSVVAAASSAAKYWSTRGGFTSTVLSTDKVGQVHFTWPGPLEVLQAKFGPLKDLLLQRTAHLTTKMEQRGGGVKDIELIDITGELEHTYQLRVTFDTVDSMGANFINTVLEAFAGVLIAFFKEDAELSAPGELEVIMSILSNYTPDCLVRAQVSCEVEALGSTESLSAEDFARKFRQAVRISKVDPYRATTHNKGIFNGIDAVIMATGNDFRAVEANGHAYAARSGRYAGLTDCTVEGGMFCCWLELPLAVGTIGGLTSLHPMAKRSLELLGHPTAPQLMEIAAATGLAQNFAAVRSLVTTGIQKGHMRMHLVNMLSHQQASELEMKEALTHFSDQVVSFSAVREFLELFRSRGGTVNGQSGTSS